jgi:hypothetical protein
VRRVALRSLAVTLAVALATALPSVARADEGRDRAVALVESAVAALGGPKYLGVTSAVATGIFTAFIQGQRSVPLEFVDTFVYPNRNRTEFGKKKSRIIQANADGRGWKYDGARQIVEPQGDEEVRAFERFVRANIDNILRGAWRQEGANVVHIGRTEIAPRTYAEGVAVEYADGFRVEIFFDPQTKLPVLSRYREGAESGAEGSLVETRYHLYLDFGGIMAPRTVDLYRDQAQTARIVYDDVKFNVPVDAKVFVQPANAKELK